MIYYHGHRDRVGTVRHCCATLMPFAVHRRLSFVVEIVYSLVCHLI